MKCLVFHLCGPMAAWGDAFAGSYRTSQTYPGKSAIVGIVSAALGLDRMDAEGQESLFRDFDYGVYASGLETKITDYHTVGTSKTPSDEEVIVGGIRRHELGRGEETMISHREYVCNGMYSVYMFPHDGNHSLEGICEALRKPVYTPYLGRKSCPLAFPMCPEIIDGERPFEMVVSNAMKPFMNPDMPTRMMLDRSRHPRIYATFQMDDGEGRCLYKGRCRDDLADRNKWSFSERTEYCYEVL